MNGARAVQKSILKKFPETDLDVTIVWIDMLASDNAQAARRSAKMFDDPRVRQFHDPRATRLAGKAFAHGLIQEGRGLAWDIYMFYERGARWDEHPPQPAEWMHQLGGGQRADADRFRSGPELEAGLREAMQKLAHK